MLQGTFLLPEDILSIQREVRFCRIVLAIMEEIFFGFGDSFSHT